MSESVSPAPVGLLDKVKAFAAAVPAELVTIRSPDGDSVQVQVRAMPGAVKKLYREATRANKDDLPFAEAKLVVLSCYDPAAGQPLFSDDHLPLIKDAPFLFEGVLAAINRVNGWADAGKAG